MIRRILILALCPTLAVFAAGGGSATWTGAIDNNWFNAGNWSGNVVPVFGDTATILNTVNNPVILNNGGISNLTLGTGTSLNIGGKFFTGDPHTINSAIVNNGSIILTASTTLITSVTVSGSGTLTLVGDPAAQTGAQIGTAGPVWTLNNQGTIEGSGLIGASSYQLQMFDDVNLVNTGTINANQTAATLRIAGLGPSRLNLGVLEATNGGILELAPQLTPENGGVVHLPPPNPVFVNGGTISAEGAGSSVHLLGATVAGGTLSTSNGGTIETVTTAVLDGSTAGGITLSDGSTYIARVGTLTDLTGSLNLGSATASTFNLQGNLRLVGDATIAGPGTFNLNGSEIGTDGTARALTLATNVQGAGLIGSGNAPLSSNLTLTNNGSINANVTGQTLVIAGTGSVTNNGLLQAGSGGILQLSSGPITGGNLQADGTGSVVNVGTTLAGATLTSTNGGVFQTFGTATLDGSSAGPITLNPGTVYNAGAGTLTQITGTMNLNAGSAFNLGGQLQLTGDTVLSGAGGLNMTAGSEIGTNGGSFTLSNSTTISGAGLIGSNSAPLSDNLGFANSGVVNANVTGQTLRIAATVPMSNAGTLQANGGTLEIASAFDNSAGIVSSDGSGSFVNLAGATVRGGTLATSNGGVIQTVGSATLDGLTAGAITIAADSTVTLPRGTNTTVQGNLILTGGSFSSIELGGQMTLAGDTYLSFNNPVPGILNLQLGSLITTNGAAVTLTNASIISGTGVIGANGDALNVVNNGTIINAAAGDLTIGGSGLVTNNGALIAQGASYLRVTASLSNFSGGVLSGGTFQAYDGTLQLSSLGEAGGEIVSNASFILLSGAGANIVDGANLNALSGFQDNLASGTFVIESGQEFSTAPAAGHDFTTEGYFEVDAGASFTTTGNFVTTGYTKVDGVLTAGEVDVDNGGLLTGLPQHFNASLVVNPGGTVDFRDDPGTVNVLGDLTLNGELEEDIAGTVASGLFGAIDLPGKATLGGNLDIVLLNGYDPAPNSQSSYVILDAAMGVSGRFSAVTFANLGLGESFRLDYSIPDEVILDLDGTTTPEPGMYALLGIGLAGLAAFRLNRSSGR